MNRRTRFAGMVVAIVVLCAAGFGTWRYISPEPTYHGRSLSYWVDHLLAGEHEANAKETFDALKTIGPPAAARLVRALAATDPPRKNFYARVRSKLPAWLNARLPHPFNAAVARNNAYGGLSYIGSAAKGQIPQLTKLLKHPDQEVREHAAMLLAGLGVDAQTATSTVPNHAHD